MDDGWPTIVTEGTMNTSVHIGYINHVITTNPFDFKIILMFTTSI